MKFKSKSILLLFALTSVTAFLVMPLNVEAAISASKTIDGCAFSVAIRNPDGSQPTTPLTNKNPYWLHVSKPLNTACANFKSARIGFISSGKKSIYGCRAFAGGTYTESFKLEAYLPGNGDKEINKYVVPVTQDQINNGACQVTEETETKNIITIQSSFKEGSSGGGGGGGGGTGDPPPKDPPTPTTAICTTVGPDGKKVVKTIDLSKGEKCPGGTLSCANGATLTDGLCVGKDVKTLYNPIKSNTLVGLSLWIMKMFLAGVAALAIVFIVMGSFRLVVSRGNPEAVTRGKDILIWSIAGLAVALLAFSLVGMVQNLLGAF